jgi:nucleotide-binding universal stress UspA family protein
MSIYPLFTHTMPRNGFMYDSILIPVDLSATNDRVLDRALELGMPGKTGIFLLHVIEVLDDIPVEEDPEFYDELRENADEKIESWAGHLTEKGFSVTAEIQYGQQGQDIVATARDHDIDLIVMRSHIVDPDEESRDQVGTVSHQVALFAPCSVLLVRG